MINFILQSILMLPNQTKILVTEFLREMNIF